MSDEENAALVIKTGIEQMFVPLHQLLEKLLGPAATEVGLSFRDSAKVWRFKRQIRLLQEVRRIVEQVGGPIKPVATRLFFPVLEAGTIEDDDEMQTRWAALLASEAINPGSVHPSFIDILKQLAPDDARLLDELYDHCMTKHIRKVKMWVKASELEQVRRRDAGEHPKEAFENLLRVGLVQPVYKLIDGTAQFKIVNSYRHIFKPSQLIEEYELSDVAFKFVEVCRAPTKVRRKTERQEKRSGS